jgi:DNA repair protein RadC
MDSSPPVLARARRRRPDEWPPDGGLTVHSVKLPLVVPARPCADGNTVEVVAKSYRFRLGTGSVFEKCSSRVRAVASVAEMAQQLIGGQIDESILAFFFDMSDRFMGYTEVARGTLNQAQIHPRDVLRPAFLVGAGSVILAHNHPTSQQSPSHADRVMTRTFDLWLRRLGVPLIEHLVVTRYTWYAIKTDELVMTCDQVV